VKTDNEMNVMSEVFIHNVKKWRKHNGITQKTLAERCNTAHAYIRQLESGTGYPSFAFIEKLANALNIEPYMLFYNEKAADNEKAIMSESLNKAKLAFLANISSELDIVLNKIKSN